MTAVVKATEVSCFYGITLGLNNVSFEIGPGITGLVGPNGAGKSTLIKLVTGQLAPSSGLLEVYGARPRNNPAILSQIGYCPEHERMHKDLKPLELMRALGMLSGIPWRETKAKAEAALQRVGLDAQHWHKRIGSYSKGMKQRVKLAQAILHGPQLVILDEPMNGLDPMGRKEIGDILKQLHGEGIDILISSHILKELELLCSHFLMVNWGRALASGSSRAIKVGMKNWSEQALIRCSDAQAVVSALSREGMLKGYLEREEGLIVWLSDPERFYKSWPIHLAECGSEIYELRNETKSLTSIFERITQ